MNNDMQTEPVTRMKKNLIAYVILGAMLTACHTTPQNVPVVERAPGSPKSSEVKVPPKSVIKADERGYYTVKKGDTLIHIALELGQSYRDLIAWNNLSDPNDIKVDQALRVVPPEPGTIIPGAQTGSVTPPASEVKPLTPASTAMVNNKTGPRGDKRVYSDAMLAEMQKPEPVSSASDDTSAGKPVVKSGDTTNAEDAGISWTWPTDGKVVTTFDEGRKGVDIAGKLGQPVVVAATGKVMYAGSGIRGYGNLVIVKHSGNIVSAYAHNNTILVKEGQMVTKGQKIAEMGSTDAESVGLHFEIRRQGKPVDPLKLLPAR